MVKIPRESDIAYLLGRRYPIEHALVSSPSAAGVFSEKREAAKARISSYKAELEAMTADERRAVYEQEKTKEWQDLIAQADEEDQQRFFHQPDARADFVHWSKTAHWTLDEAVALAFGKNPEVVHWERIQWLTVVSPFAKQYAQLRDLTLRAKLWEQLHDPVLPGMFLAWARRTDIEVASELLKQVEERGTLVADWRSICDHLEIKLAEKEREIEGLIANGASAEGRTADPSLSPLSEKSGYWRKLERKASLNRPGFTGDSNS